MLRRRIMAVGSAALLTFTVTTAPLSAADMGLPTKAPTLEQPVITDYTWVYVGAGLVLIGAGLWICYADCGCLKSCQSCNSPGAC